MAAGLAATVCAQIREVRMTRIFHRSIGGRPPEAVAGQGIYITDSEGRSYIDASGGAAVSCLGHGHPDVLAAMQAQLDKLAYAHTSFFTTDVAEELADDLVGPRAGRHRHVYFVSGGSEAIEAALKMARQYFVEIGEPQRRHFIARRQSYHGNTLGALAAGGNAWRRAQFAPLLIETPSRLALLRLSRTSSDERDAGGLRRAPRRRAGGEVPASSAPETVIAFVAETVVGATSGRHAGSRLFRAASARSATGTASC